MNAAKLVLFWVLGGVFILFGSWILNNLELTTGVSQFSYMFALIIALAAFFIAGLFWISVAVATRH